jgi:hypothetical protein
MMAKSAEVCIGKVINNLDIQEIKSFDIKCDIIMGAKEHSLKQSFFIPSLMVGRSKVIIWVKNVAPLNKLFKGYDKKDLINYLNAVELEQSRLAEILNNDGADEGIKEIQLNQNYD